MSQGRTLVELAILFSQLSLLAIGGAMPLLPDMHRQAVEIAGWMTDAQFAQLFAIAQAAPGPNMLVVTLIGFQAAGILGAIVATLCLCVPSCVLTFFVAKLWHRFRASPIRRAVQRGMAPVTVGLVLASGWVLVDASDHGWWGFLLTAVTAAVALMTRINPVWPLLAAGLLGLAGMA